MELAKKGPRRVDEIGFIVPESADCEPIEMISAENGMMLFIQVPPSTMFKSIILHIYVTDDLTDLSVHRCLVLPIQGMQCNFVNLQNPETKSFLWNIPTFGQQIQSSECWGFCSPQIVLSSHGVCSIWYKRYRIL
jgi:hypothetical protein